MKNLLLLLLLTLAAQLCSSLHTSSHATAETTATIHQQTADLSGHINITNLGGENWILGDLTAEQYEIVRFDIVQKNSVIQCPIDTPYVINGTTDCKQCSYPTPLFVLANNTCAPCPKVVDKNSSLASICSQKSTATNSTANSSSTQPQPTNPTDLLTDVFTNINITNLDANNWILGEQTMEEYLVTRFGIVSKENVTQCDVQTPYVMKGATDCQQCPEDRPIFVLSNDSCVSCPPGEVWNYTLSQCVIAPKVNKTDNKTTNNTTTPNATTPNATTPNATTLNTTKPNATTPNATTPNTTTPNTTPNTTTPNTTTPNNNSATNDTKTGSTTPNNTTPNTTVPNNTTPNTTTPNDTKVASATPNATVNNTTSPNNTNTTTPNNTTPNTSQPLNASTLCVETTDCPKGGFFNHLINACDHCQVHQYFDEQFQACLFCPDATPLLDSSFTCTACPKGLSIDRPTNRCI